MTRDERQKKGVKEEYRPVLTHRARAIFFTVVVKFLVHFQYISELIYNPTC